VARIVDVDLGEFEFIHEMTSKPARTGEVIDSCRDCPHALIVDGDNVEGGEILFCKKFFDFPVRRIKVVFIPDRIRIKYTEKRYCKKHTH
jgi:hypothetical protein